MKTPITTQINLSDDMVEVLYNAVHWVRTYRHSRALQMSEGETTIDDAHDFLYELLKESQ